MTKSKHRRTHKNARKLPDLEQSKSAVMNSLTSASSKRSYDPAIREFIGWYCSEARLAFNRTVVTRDRMATVRSEEHTSELQSRSDLVCRLLLEKKKTKSENRPPSDLRS